MRCYTPYCPGWRPSFCSAVQQPIDSRRLHGCCCCRCHCCRRPQTTTPALEQFRLLHERWHSAGAAGRRLLLSSYLRLLLAAPGDAELRAQTTAALERAARQMDAELQQRATEYLALAADPGRAAAFVLPAPKWEGRSSALLRRLAVRHAAWFRVT